jgi:nucleotide-binding universal stress UspA family protein
MTPATSGFGTILVPLDGSERAERALPVASHLARATGSSLLLARVISLLSPVTLLPAEGAYVDPVVYQQLLEDEERLAREYLEHQAAPLLQQGLAVRTYTVRGDAAGSLIAIEVQEQVGLVVMTTHGRTGLARFALGSIADRLVRGGRVPVLLLRSFAPNGPRERLVRALVALDGSRRAEAALDICQPLAGRVVQQVELVQVVDTGEAEAGAPSALAARQYLEDVRERLTPEYAAHRCELSTLVLSGEPAEQIGERAERDGAMIILATHGRSGVMRWALGSVADRVLRGTSVPLLLVRSAQRD